MVRDTGLQHTDVKKSRQAQQGRLETQQCRGFHPDRGSVTSHDNASHERWEPRADVDCEGRQVDRAWCWNHLPQSQIPSASPAHRVAVFVSWHQQSKWLSVYLDWNWKTIKWDTRLNKCKYEYLTSFCDFFFWLTWVSNRCDSAIPYHDVVDYTAKGGE